MANEPFICGAYSQGANTYDYQCFVMSASEYGDWSVYDIGTITDHVGPWRCAVAYRGSTIICATPQYTASSPQHERVHMWRSTDYGQNWSYVGYWATGVHNDTYDLIGALADDDYFYLFIQHTDYTVSPNPPREMRIYRSAAGALWALAGTVSWGTYLEEALVYPNSLAIDGDGRLHIITRGSTAGFAPYPMYHRYSDNQGASFSARATIQANMGSSTNPVSCFAVDEHIFASGPNGVLMVSHNQGASWAVNATPSFGSGRTKIVLIRHDGNAYLYNDNTSPRQLYYATDWRDPAGPTWSVYQNLAYGLTTPSGYVDPQGRGAMLVGDTGPIYHYRADGERDVLALNYSIDYLGCGGWDIPFAAPTAYTYYW